MDGLHVDTFGTLPIDGPAKNSALSQDTSNLDGTCPNRRTSCWERGTDIPNSGLCRVFDSLYILPGNDDKSLGVNKSALELAIRRIRAARLTPLPSKKEDDHHSIALMEERSTRPSPSRLAGENKRENSADESCIGKAWYWLLRKEALRPEFLQTLQTLQLLLLLLPWRQLWPLSHAGGS
ncbi:hypothetical protein F4777DRAFT_579822 [Nemania sp. FL0916]|nr:hypothetical protein F4777DRAFT_579822 [Nemania sp. FL0916]